LPMRSRLLFLAAALATALGATHAAAGARGARGAAEPTLIPRAVLFGNAPRAHPLLSPDGSRVAWLAPEEHGVKNVWVQAGDDSARAMTHEAHRPIGWYAWAGDSRHLLYLQDSGGDERNHLYTVDLVSGATRDLTPYPGVRAQNVLVSPAD